MRVDGVPRGTEMLSIRSPIIESAGEPQFFRRAPGEHPLDPADRVVEVMPRPTESNHLLADQLQPLGPELGRRGRAEQVEQGTQRGTDDDVLAGGPAVPEVIGLRVLPVALDQLGDRKAGAVGPTGTGSVVGLLEEDSSAKSRA